jgi:RNA polymerase sigma factor (sigma-70 family)
LLPLLVEGYERYLEQMGRVAVGSQVVVGWFHLRAQLERDIQEAAARFEQAKLLAARARYRARKNGLEGSWFSRDGERGILRAMDEGWSREIGLGSGDPGPLSRTSREQKAVRIINRTVAIIEGARDRLVLPNFRLILKEVFRYNPAGMKRSDLFQEGILGLHRAVFRYDPERKTRFSTYATYWIRQAIRKSLIDRSRLIRIPQAVRLTEQEVQRLRRVMGEGVSLSAGEDDDPRDRLSFESLQLSGPSHHEQLHIGVIPEAVEKALLGLESREREILKRRFGIGGDRVQTLEEIGVALHLSRERIRQIEREALEKMKRQGALQAVYEELS